MMITDVEAATVDDLTEIHIITGNITIIISTVDTVMATSGRKKNSSCYRKNVIGSKIVLVASSFKIDSNIEPELYLLVSGYAAKFYLTLMSLFVENQSDLRNNDYPCNCLLFPPSLWNFMCLQSNQLLMSRHFVICRCCCTT